MKELLAAVTEPTIVIIDAIALLLVIIGTVQAFYTGMKLMLGTPNGHEGRLVWLRYARWLVAALTFQLAADIIETSITESWEALGRIAVVAVIRTFLNYFLERDLEETRERERVSTAEPEKAR